MAFVVLSIAIGAACAVFHQRVFMLLLLSALVAAAAVLGGLAVHAHPWVIAGEALSAITAVQFGYIALGLTVRLVRDRNSMPYVPIAIGRRLRVELEVPRDLTPRLAALVGKLPLLGHNLPSGP
jgi:hypothetical protein